MNVNGLNQKQNRNPAFAGKFYPASEKVLAGQLKKLFSEAKPPTGDKPTPEGKHELRAIISPHAGYVFSGGVAASAFNQIPENKSFKRVFILASSHQFHFPGAALYNAGNYVTPLGEIEVDMETVNQLIDSSSLFQARNEAHEDEHSLEVQLPFLQYKLNSPFLLVPIILGTDNPRDCREIARALQPWFTSENLFVISSDFSHYPGYHDATDNDLRTANAICSNQPEELLSTLEKNQKRRINHLATSLCGWTSVLTLLHLTGNQEVEYQKIEYQNSGDATLYGDKDHVVGYWAIAAFKKGNTFSLSDEEKEELLEKARNAITQSVVTGKKGPVQLPKAKNILSQKAGVFVSIYINNELRGCIGHFAREETLGKLVQRMAVSATSDQRFEPVKADELKHMELEISVLSPLKKIDSPDEIELGKHGIYIEKGGRSGTFLPQVAQKTNWNLKNFLGLCSRDKAGIGWEGWKTANLYTYEAVVFRG